MEIPGEFWDWDFRRQRAWVFTQFPDASYDLIDAAHGAAIAWQFPLPREFCGLTEQVREAFVHWEIQVSLPVVTQGGAWYGPWAYVSDIPQITAALNAACRQFMLNAIPLNPGEMAAFRWDLSAFGGPQQMIAWGRAHPSDTNPGAEGYLAGGVLGGSARAAAYVYPAGQAAARRLRAPVARSRRRPRLALTRSSSGHVTVLPVINVQGSTQTHALPQDQPPLPPVQIYPTPQPPIPSPVPAQTHSILPTPVTQPAPPLSAWWIVGGVAAVAAGGYMLYRATKPSPSSRHSEPSPLEWAQKQARMRERMRTQR